MIHLIILLLFQKIRGNFTLYLRREKPEVYLIGANFNKIDLEKANVKKIKSNNRQRWCNKNFKYSVFFHKFKEVKIYYYYYCYLQMIPLTIDIFDKKLTNFKKN